MSSDINIVIFTALEKERDAILRYLKKVKDTKIDNRYYKIKCIKKNNIEYKVILVCSEKQGSIHSAVATMQVIHYWNPDYIILTGIMAGIEKENERNLGDLIIADSIVEFISGKEITDKTLYKSDSYHVDKTLLTESKKFAENFSFKPPHYYNFPQSNHLPLKHFAPIACVEKVVNSLDKIEELKEHKYDLAGIEMEGYGIACAASSELNKGILIIKAISDWAHDKDDKWRKYAMDVAADFTVQFINYLIANNLISSSKPSESSSNDHEHILDIQVNFTIKARWLISKPDLWSDYIKVLHFAKIVHHVSQLMEKEVFDDDINHLDNLDDRHLKKIWDSYEDRIKGLSKKEREIFLNISLYATEEINRALDNIVTMYKDNFNKNLIVDTDSLKSHYTSVTDVLSEYSKYHKEISVFVSHAPIAMSTYRDDTFKRCIRDMKNGVGSLCSCADMIIKLLVEMLLQE